MTPSANPFPAATPHAPPPKKRPVLVIVALVLGIPLVACLLLGGLGVLVSSTAKKLPLAAGDDAAFVTAEDLFASTGQNVKPDPAKVKQGREKQLGGSVEISYEYESEAPPLYVSTLVSIEKSASSAKNTYLGQSVGGLAGMAIAGQGLTLEDRDDLFKWGEQSKHKRLMMEGKPVGHFFITRKDKRVFTTIFSGVYFDDAESLSALLTPRLAAMEKLEP